MPDEVTAALARIESKLDALLSALADEEDQKPGLTLDGDPAGDERQGGLDLG